MKPPAEKKPFPAWLRFLVWLGFILLALAMPLSLARWLMESSHQTAVALVKPRGKLPKASARNGVAVSPPQKESAASRGIPLAELPLVGVYIGDGLAAKKELEKQVEEISSWRTPGCWVDGVLSFRAVLAKMGMAVPETMTEAEAATEFLKWTERFSAVLAQWREAVCKGSWDFSSLTTYDSFAKRSKIFNVAYDLQFLLSAMAEARLRTGDTGAAYSDLQTMVSSADRCGDMPGFSQIMLSCQMFWTAHAGMELGAWTDTELSGISTMLGEEHALAKARREVDLKKLVMADSFAHFREPQSGIAGSFVDSARSSVGHILNQIGVAMTTDQQIADNLAVINFQMDQPLTRFDPGTGFYLGGSAGDSRKLPHSNPSDASFDQFYYMYSQNYGGDQSWMADRIILDQSNIDQTRIAAALEIQRRATGGYPETLDAVSAIFGGKIPRDIATGQPYFYQRDADGGYKLWGTGIDGKSDGGDERADVTWIHRPVKK